MSSCLAGVSVSLSALCVYICVYACGGQRITLDVVFPQVPLSHFIFKMHFYVNEYFISELCVCLVFTEASRGHWIPGTGVTDSCALPCGC